MGDIAEESVQQALNSDKIAEMTKTVLDKIKANPKQLKSILSQLDGNEQVLGQVLKVLENNPSLKQQAASSIKKGGRATEQVNRLSSREKREMAQRARRAKAAAESPKIQALIINNSRQVKPYLLNLNTSVPRRHQEICCEPHILRDGIELHYCRNATPHNKKAESLLGLKLGGEVIIVHKDGEGRPQHLEIETLQNMLEYQDPPEGQIAQ